MAPGTENAVHVTCPHSNHKAIALDPLSSKNKTKQNIILSVEKVNIANKLQANNSCLL